MNQTPEAVEAASRGAGQAVGRCLAVLDHVRRESVRQRGVTVADLASRFRMHRTTADVVVQTMTRAGLLRLDDRGVVRLGEATVVLARAYTASLGLRAAAQEPLADLAVASRGVCTVAVLDGGDVRRVHRASVAAPAAGSDSRLEAHCCADGKALLAFATPQGLDDYLDRGLRRRTAQTITDPQRLRRDLELVRERGFAVEDGEAHPRLRAVAAPVRDREGRVVAAVGTAVASHEMPPPMVRVLAVATMSAAQLVSRALGCPATAPLSRG